jgi:hypothetical protein
MVDGGLLRARVVLDDLSELERGGGMCGVFLDP